LSKTSVAAISQSSALSINLWVSVGQMPLSISIAELPAPQTDDGGAAVEVEATMEEVVGASVVAGGFLDDVVVGAAFVLVDDVVGAFVSVDDGAVFVDDVVGSSVTGLSVTGVSVGPSVASQMVQKEPGLL